MKEVTDDGYRYVRGAPLPPMHWLDFYGDDEDDDDRSFSELCADILFPLILWGVIGAVGLAIIGVASFVAIWSFTAVWNVLHANWLFFCT